MFSLTAQITTPLYYETLGWVGHLEALPTIAPHPQKLNVSNFSGVTDLILILMKL